MSWEKFLSHENFELAWRRIRNSSISTTKDRLGLKVFSQAIDFHISQLIQDVYNGNYIPSSPAILYSPKKSGRLRPFTLLSMRDRLLYQAIGNILIENTYDYLKIEADVSIFHPVLVGISEDYIFHPSLRRGENFEGQYLKFIKRQAELINSGEFTCVVQADIASFYPSIDHYLLINKLYENNWLDPEICSLLGKCLEIWSSYEHKLAIHKSLPIGYETSDLLANLFLQEIDSILNDYEYLRYVDDVRIFAESAKKGTQILNELDVILQKQGLLLQATKSKVENLSDWSIEERLKHLEEQQLLLSDIDRQINSPSEAVQEIADQKIRALLIEVLGIEEWEDVGLDELVEPTEETSLFFSLYRIREKNIQLRDISLKLLDTHPHRSYAIVKYLKLFRDDTQVTTKLWEIVLDNSKHGQVRANCLRGLYELGNDILTIKDIVKNWILEDDLTLSFCAVEIIQQFNDEKNYLLELENVVKSPQILYALVSTIFTLLESRDEKSELISRCFHDEDYMIISLGVYFVSTQMNLLSEVKLISNPIVTELIKIIQQRISIDKLEQNLQELFGVQATAKSNILNSLPDSTQLNQLVINMILSRETNRDEYLRNLTEFLVEFSGLYESITENKFVSLINHNEAIKEAFDYAKVGLINLSDFKSSLTFLGTKPALDYIDTEKLHKGVSQAIDKAINEIIDLLLDKQDTLKDEELKKDEPYKPLIFFSYSHDDETHRKKLMKRLKFLEIYGLARLWCDRQIPAGDVWSLDIEEKLNESEIVLFLISSNFMGSSFIYNEEMPRARDNYKAKKTVCIPIILEDCSWEFPPYKHLQALPKDAKPITHWKLPDSAYKYIEQEIQKVLVMLKDGTFMWKVLP